MNHFQSRSCSKSQILIDWVTYRYFFFEIRCFREFKNFFHTFRSALTHCHESAPVQDISMFLHKTNHTESKFQHGNKSFQCVWKIDAANSALLRSFFHLRSIFTSFHANHANHATLRWRNTSWKFQKQSGAKVTQKWQKDTKTTFSKQLLKFWTNNKNKEIHMWYTETTQWPELRLTGSFNFTSIFFHLATTTTATMHLFFTAFRVYFLLENDWNPRHSNDSYCWGFRQSWDPNLILSAFKPCLGMRTYFCYNKMINGKIRQDGTIQNHNIIKSLQEPQHQTQKQPNTLSQSWGMDGHVLRSTSHAANLRNAAKHLTYR